MQESHDPPPVLSYANPGPRLRRILRRTWWAVLVAITVWVIALLLALNPAMVLVGDWLGMGLMATPVAPVNFDRGDTFLLHPFNEPTRDYLLHVGLFLGLLLLMQWLFLAPHGSLKLRLEAAGQPMGRAAIAAGFIAMLLSIGLAATLLEWPFRSGRFGETTSRWLRWTLARPGGIQDFRAIWLAMLILWAFWGMIFSLYGRRLDRHTWLRRVFRFLLGGTILELLVSAPAHAWIARKDDCYCARGSYTGLVFGCTALAWLFGPGLFLLLLREKRRLEGT